MRIDRYLQEIAFDDGAVVKYRLTKNGRADMVRIHTFSPDATDDKDLAYYQKLFNKIQRDKWGTPEHIYKPVVERYSLDHDAAAEPNNAVCQNYWTPTQNALEQDWSGKRIWCNPPYSETGRWVDKALESSDAYVVAMLVPASVGDGWYTRALKGCSGFYLYDNRIRFVPPFGVPQSSPRGGNTLFLFHRHDKSGRYLGLLKGRAS